MHSQWNDNIQKIVVAIPVELGFADRVSGIDISYKPHACFLYTKSTG